MNQKSENGVDGKNETLSQNEQKKEKTERDRERERGHRGKEKKLDLLIRIPGVPASSEAESGNHKFKGCQGYRVSLRPVSATLGAHTHTHFTNTHLLDPIPSSGL